MALVVEALPFLLKATLVTIVLALASMLIGLVAGLFAALARVAKIPVLGRLARAYVSLARGTPLLVQIYVVYYGLPQIGINFSPITSAIIALSFNTGAYLSESFRAAIESVPRGQYEAGYSIGMTYGTVMQRIVIPQSIRTAIPTIGNTFVSLMKDTSLVSVITVTELLRQATVIIARTYQPLTLYLTAAAIYWILNSAFGLWQDRYEKGVSRHV